MNGNKIIFTLCSNNYLAQALVLSESVRLNQPAWKFYIGLVDKKDRTIDYNGFDCEVLEASVIEPDIDSLAKKYSIVELNTCVKPAFFRYFFEALHAEQVIYLDPDICLYGPMTDIDQNFSNFDFILTPHILTPIPLDGYSPQESLFLNYGIYNLGFIALKKTEQTLRFLVWWKDRTYQYGFDKPAVGLFTDQLWINLLPVYFEKVKILSHPGYNMAPWNLHERSLLEKEGIYLVNSNQPLVFFHFSGFDPEKEKIHKDYSRFRMDQRPDLSKLYNDYKLKLEARDYRKYKTIACHYVKLRNEFLNWRENVDKKQQAIFYESLPLYKKIIRTLKRNIPSGLKNTVLKLIRT